MESNRKRDFWKKENIGIGSPQICVNYHLSTLFEIALELGTWITIEITLKELLLNLSRISR